MTTEHETNRLDQVTSSRLARLANRPVDTSHLEDQLQATLRATVEPDPPARALRFPQWMTAALSAAAVVVLVLSIGWMLFQKTAAPAVAAPADLAQIHFDITRGLSPHLTVSTVDEANRLLAEQSSGARPMPKNLPGQIMSCCLHQYAGTTLTCALIDQGGQLITVALADGQQLKSPSGERMVRDDRQLTVHYANGITMVMAHENGRWLCVMGEASNETLIRIAAAVQM
ncbi:MAG: hypothetical protein D8M59_16730 [Planctomycetes bacterium]|nr:hypothetical protein [Planctomycetota bacterium]NOG53134.1 hypothetical protein [Planctomycetota bacterium]